MGEKDSGGKLLEDFPDVFADIINVLAFHGERLLLEENIVSGPTSSIYKDAFRRLREHLRDITKFDKKENLFFAVMGLENQGTVDMDMVFRIMGYDYGSYRTQIDSSDKKRYPVFSLVLYFGLKPWTAPKNLYDALEITEDLPYRKYLPELISNLKINVFEIAYLPAEIREQFTSDFRIIADYFCGIREGREEEFFSDNRAFKHVEEMLDFFRIFSGDKRYEEIKGTIMEKADKGEVISMCTLLDSAICKGMLRGEQEGRLRGEQVGRLRGEQEGRLRGEMEVYSGLIDEGILTTEFAAKKMGISITEFLAKKEEIIRV